LAQLSASFRALFNDNANDRKKWGGGIMGTKANHVTRYRAQLAAKEAAKQGAVTAPTVAVV